jgi:hypothetical protein
MSEKNQTPPGKTGANVVTPKSIPSGPLKPARTTKHNTPTGAGSMSRGRQGRGDA